MCRRESGRWRRLFHAPVANRRASQPSFRHLSRSRRGRTILLPSSDRGRMASKALVRSVREVSIRKAFGSNSFKGGCAARSDRASYSTSTSALRSGVSAVESPLGEGRIGLKVRVSEKVTQRAYDEAFEELGRSVQFPGFRKKKGGISDPLPRNLILQVVGKKRIAQFVVDGLVTETVCDHAEEMGYKLRDDISASGIVPDIQHVRVSSELMGSISSTKYKG